MRFFISAPRWAAAWLLALLSLSVCPGFAQTSPLMAAWLGTVNASTLTISNLPSNGRVAQLLSAIVGPASATCRVVTAALPPKQVGAIDFTANATTTSGLQLSYSSSDPTVAIVNNNLISIVRPGTIQITTIHTYYPKYLYTKNFMQLLAVGGTLASATPQLVQQAALVPNPAHGEVALYLPTALQNEPPTATVLNVLGQSVLAQRLVAGAGTARTLPLAGVAAGVYIVRLDTPYGTVSKRLLAE